MVLDTFCDLLISPITYSPAIRFDSSVQIEFVNPFLSKFWNKYSEVIIFL